jgi:hypothetical protein
MADIEVTVGAAEAHDEQFGIVLAAFHLHIGHLNARYLLGTHVHMRL